MCTLPTSISNKSQTGGRGSCSEVEAVSALLMAVVRWSDSHVSRYRADEHKLFRNHQVREGASAFRHFPIYDSLFLLGLLLLHLKLCTFLPDHHHPCLSNQSSPPPSPFVDTDATLLPVKPVLLTPRDMALVLPGEGQPGARKEPGGTVTKGTSGAAETQTNQSIYIILGCHFLLC